MDTLVQDTSPDGMAQEPEALDKPAGEAAPAGRQERLALQLERLGRLADMAMQLAEGLTRKAAKVEAAGGATAGEGYESVCLAFTRLSRAVRQINFQEQEILGLRDTAEREARQARETAAQEARDMGRRREKRIVYQTVHELLGADRPLRDDVMFDLNSALDKNYNDYRDLYQGSFEEIIARICRDLGIDAAPEAGIMTDDADMQAFDPADTPIGARQRIQAAADCIRSTRGTGPP